MLSIDTYELANGLRVVLNEDHSAPLVAVNLWYHVGSKNERPAAPASPTCSSTCSSPGSQHVGNNEHFRYVQSVGGVLNGTTFFDRTNYFETLPSNYLALGLWLESDRMGFFLPALTQENLDIQREVVKEERRQRYDNVPYGTAFERSSPRLSTPTTPTTGRRSARWRTSAPHRSTTSASSSSTWYRPDNCVLTLVGDFNPAEAKRARRRVFRRHRAGRLVPAVRPDAAAAGRERREDVPVAACSSRGSTGCITCRRWAIADWIHADLLSTILASDKASRLERVARAREADRAGRRRLRASDRSDRHADDAGDREEKVCRSRTSSATIDEQIARIVRERSHRRRDDARPEPRRDRIRASDRELRLARRSHRHVRDVLRRPERSSRMARTVSHRVDRGPRATSRRGTSCPRIARRASSCRRPHERRSIAPRSPARPAPSLSLPARHAHDARRTACASSSRRTTTRRSRPLRTLVRSGADHDVAELAGLASLTADLLDEGAGSRDAIRLAEDSASSAARSARAPTGTRPTSRSTFSAETPDRRSTILADVSFRAIASGRCARARAE